MCHYLNSTCLFSPLFKSTPHLPPFSLHFTIISILFYFTPSLVYSLGHRSPPFMAEQHQLQQRPTDAIKSFLPEKGPSTSQVLAVVTLLPVGGALLGLAGLTLVGTLIGLAITTPLFVIFSPILVPAVIAIGLAVTGFLTSGAFGITALSSLSWILNYVRRMRGTIPEQLDQTKRRVQDTAGQAGQKVRDMGQRVQETARS